MTRFLHAFLLVAAFLFAQVGMSVHAASHGQVKSHGSDQGLAIDDACELCVGYAQLAGSAPLPAQPFVPVFVARLQVHAHRVAFFPNQTLVHTRSRAPPVFS